MNISMLFTLVLVIYMIYLYTVMGKRTKKSQELNSAMQNFYDKEKLFPDLERFIEQEQDPLYLSKYRIIQAWAAAYYNEEELFKKAVDEIDVDILKTNGKKSIVLQQEDSFYYMYLGIPNRLYYEGRMDLIEYLYKKLEQHDNDLNDYLFHHVAMAMRKYYAGEGDLGRSVFESVNNGDYEGLAYSKQLIGVYKNICSSFLAAIAMKTDDSELFESQRTYLETFAKSNLGERWLSELGIDLGGEAEEEVTEDEEETEEVTGEEEETE